MSSVTNNSTTDTTDDTSANSTTDTTNSTTSDTNPITLKVSDAYDLISKKILINRISIESLEMQLKFSIASMKYQKLIASNAHAKIKLVKKLNEVLESQLKEFTAERQEQCMHLYKEINDLDKPTPEYISNYNECKDLEDKIIELIRKVEYLESTIPDSQDVNNYFVKLSNQVNQSSDTETSGLSSGLPSGLSSGLPSGLPSGSQPTTCSKEVLGFGLE
jgi:hypothetical protein